MTDDAGAQGALVDQQPTGFLDGYNVQVSATGLVLPADMDFDRYRDLVRLLGAISSAVPWYIGDTVNHGEAQYGEAYAQAMNDFGLAYQTLANYAHTCRWVHPDVRRDDLSFGHHAAVANMAHEVGGMRVPDKERQRYWLALAVEKDWARSDLRAAIAAEAATQKSPPEAAALDAEPVGGGGGEAAGEQVPQLVQQAQQERVAQWEAAAPQLQRALRDVYDTAVPVQALAQRAGGYYAVPEDVMVVVAQALGEEWVAPLPAPGQQPVVEGVAVQVPAAPPGDDDVQLVAPQPQGAPQGVPVGQGETFDGFG